MNIYHLSPISNSSLDSYLVYAENEESARKSIPDGLAQAIPPGKDIPLQKESPYQNKKKVRCRTLESGTHYNTINIIDSKKQIDIEFNNKTYYLPKGHAMKIIKAD